jgi:hypothetical protein
MLGQSWGWRWGWRWGWFSVEIAAVIKVHPGRVRSSHIDWGSRIHRLMCAMDLDLDLERNLEGLGLLVSGKMFVWGAGEGSTGTRE